MFYKHLFTIVVVLALFCYIINFFRYSINFSYLFVIIFNIDLLHSNCLLQIFTLQNSVASLA